MTAATNVRRKAPKPASTSSGSSGGGGGGQVLGSTAGSSSGSAGNGSKAWTSWEEAPRQELVSALFKALAGDASSLGQKQLRRFADFLGFEGSDADWAGEYAEMCAASGWKPAVGADSLDFPDFVNTEDSGGYCTDEMLRDMIVNHLKVPVPAAAPAESSSSSSSGAGAGRGGGRQAMQDGDWICKSCGHMNFARNTECRKCRAPKGAAAGGGAARSRSPPVSGQLRAGTTTNLGGKVTIENL